MIFKIHEMSLNLSGGLKFIKKQKIYIIDKNLAKKNLGLALKL